jgi:hypothetical protein
MVGLNMKTTKPSKRQVVDALEILLKWATGGDKHSNPYCYPEVKHALQVLALERGMSEAGWLSVELRNLPV